MVFNNDKFQLLRYGKNNSLKEVTNYKAPDGTFIKEDNNVRDLGVLMSSDGSFNIHIENFTNECKKKIGWILRTFYSRDILTMRTLFKSLILSKIDYCSPLFHPTLTATTTSKIENIQKAFTKKILNMKNLNYWDRLKSLKIQSIERREGEVCYYLYVQDFKQLGTQSRGKF